MTRASEFINYQIPNDHTRVQRLLNSIQSTDIKVVSSITKVLAKKSKRNNFEEAADFLLLATPIKISDANRLSQKVSGVGVGNNNGNSNSSGFVPAEKGSTGAE